MSDAVSRPERATLSRDFSVFLVELSVALHKHAMYPGDHPSLEPAAAAVARSAALLLCEREQISFGIARRQLIIEGVATDPDQPVLRRLAEGLHRHHLGAISLQRGVTAGEIQAALRVLSADAESDGALGLLSRDQLPTWPHVHLHPLTFDRLTLSAAAPLATGSESGNPESETRSAELWIGLARAALAGEHSSRSLPVAQVEPATVAKAIDEQTNAEAYDQVIVGYLLQIARELKDASGPEAAALRRRTGRLVAALKPETLRRLVEMGGDVAQRGAFVLDAAHGMAVDAVLEIVKAAASTSGQTISHGLVRMLSKLAAQAETGHEGARSLADSALRDQVVSLLSGWQLADPNPEAYSRFLQHVARAAPATAAARAHDGDHPGRADSLRLAQMSLEIAASGPMIEQAVDRLISEGSVDALLHMLSIAPEPSQELAYRMRVRLAGAKSIERLLAQDPIDFSVIDRLLPMMPVDGFGAMLDALAASDDRTTRRRLMDRLVRSPVDIGPLIASRLDDERWFVVRNLLGLLEQSGHIPPDFSAAPWAEHPDARVRYQAVRLQLLLPAERDQAIRAALVDSDARLVRVGLNALPPECPADVAELLVRIVDDPETDEGLRVLAVRALGRCSEHTALDALLRAVGVSKTLLGRLRMAPRTPVQLAALRGLANRWADDPAVLPILALAAQSADPDVRQSAQPDLS